MERFGLASCQARYSASTALAFARRSGATAVSTSLGSSQNCFGLRVSTASAVTFVTLMMAVLFMVFGGLLVAPLGAT